MSLRSEAFRAARRVEPPEGLRGVSELGPTLQEWHRVLKSGGVAYISVPDLEQLARLYVREDLDFNERFFVMRMMFGGQTDRHDFHRVGLDFNTTAHHLRAAGFCKVKRKMGARGFGLFDDGSTMKFKGLPISVNVVATACKPGIKPIHVSLDIDGGDDEFNWSKNK